MIAERARTILIIMHENTYIIWRITRNQTFFENKIHAVYKKIMQKLLIVTINILERWDSVTIKIK